MCYKGLIKRIVPFFLTFAAGLFIASFFVTIASPSFNFRRGPGRYREMQRKDQIIREQQQTINELRDQLEQSRTQSLDMHTVPAFPAYEPNTPPPPPVTRASRHTEFR